LKRLEALSVKVFGQLENSRSQLIFWRIPSAAQII